MIFGTVTVPANSIVIRPGTPLDESVVQVANTLMHRSNHAQLMWELSGCDYKPPYKQMLDEIDASIGRLKGLRVEMQSLAQHEHQWDHNDYCAICGADGRA